MWNETDLPKVIEDDMIKGGNYSQRNNIFHASELSYNCLLRLYYDRTEEKHTNKEGYWAMYRGRIFDKHLTKLFHENEIRVSHKVPGTNYVIKGRIDGIIYPDNGGKYELYEIKTAQYMDYMKQPRDAHINQALFYLNCYDPLGEMYIVYVSMDGFKVYKFDNNKTELNSVMQEYNRKAKELGDSLKSGTPPEPLSCKECNYCEWRGKKMCPIKKPKQKRQKRGFKKPDNI